MSKEKEALLKELRKLLKGYKEDYKEALSDRVKALKQAKKESGQWVRYELDRAAEKKRYAKLILINIRRIEKQIKDWS